MPLTLATTTPGEPEIFASIQGEGISAGKPSVFLRLSRCNLACRWCDTAYTWRFTGDNRPHRSGVTFNRKTNQVTLPESLVCEQINSYGLDRLVVTGGEPLLQSPALIKLLAMLPTMHVEVETNGTVSPTPNLDALVNQYNVSPKLRHSGNAAALALNPERLAQWAENDRAWFKFVIGDPDDVGEVVELARRHAIPHSRIMLMGEGTDTETLRERERWLAPLCITHKLTLSDRLHIHLFGDSRGT